MVTAAPRSTPTRLLLPAALARAIEQHARASYPSECCGVLVGRLGVSALIDAAYPVENRRASRRRDRYEVDPREILKLDRWAEERGQEIIGFYHSHPDHPAIPSRTDRAYAWPGYVYLIAGVAASGAAQIRAWIYDDTLQAFGELPTECEETPRPVVQTIAESEVR